MSLTAHQVSTASARPKLYALYDGHGLCLHVTPKGSNSGAPAATANEERTFETVACSWLKFLDVQVKKKLLTQDTATDARRLLERYVFPQLGSRPIGSIGPRDLLVVLKDIEIKGLLQTARRTKQRCSRVSRHAIGLGYLSRDITEDLRGFLQAPKVLHRPAITDPRRLGKLLNAMDGYNGRRTTAIALKLTPSP